MSQLICDSCERRVSGAGVSNYGCAMFLGKAWCGGTMREQKPAPKPQRLSLEECVYWLVVIGYDLTASRVASRFVESIRWEIRAAEAEVRLSMRDLKAHRSIMRNETDPNEKRRRQHGCEVNRSNLRESFTVIWLCSEALRRIREEKP